MRQILCYTSIIKQLLSLELSWSNPSLNKYARKIYNTQNTEMKRVFGAYYNHPQMFTDVYVTINTYSEFRLFRKYFMWLPFSVFKCLLCDFTSVPKCPLFYFLLLLLLMLWLLFSLISSSSRFSTVFFSFISTPYMFFQCLCISPGPSHFSIFSSFLCHFLSFSSSSSVFCRSFNFFTSLIFLSSPVWDVAIGSFFASPTLFSVFFLFSTLPISNLCVCTSAWNATRSVARCWPGCLSTKSCWWDHCAAQSLSHAAFLCLWTSSV